MRLFTIASLMPPLAAYARHYFPDRAAWRAWLTANHAQTVGIWLIYDKKTGAAPQPLTYAAIVEEALCFGWIDATAQKLSATQAMLLLTPRRRRSGWSKLNKSRVQHLTTAGLMTPAGQARIDRAVADGSWTALDAAEALLVPDDLAAALAAVPGATARFARLAASVRKGALQQIGFAKRPETRARRVAAAVQLAATAG